MWGSGLLAAAVAATALTGAPEVVVRGVFFFSPTCPHCHTVMERDLPPLEARWGGTLDLVYVDVTTPTGAALYRAAVERYRIPRDRLGVPAVILADRHLVGSAEIPAVLPGLVERAAAAGGTTWPDVPGLADALGEFQSASASVAPAPDDPVGLALGGVVFLTLLGAMGHGGYRLRTASRSTVRPRNRRRSRPASDPVLVGLAGAGLGIAGYLSWIALSGGEAACGPVGACGAVHASAFGTVAGVPVAVLGVVFFGAVLALALRPGSGAVDLPGGRPGALAALCWAGALFSLYLTGAEIFAIGAVCSWCLASALIAAALLVRVNRGEGVSGPMGAAAG